MSFLSGLLSRIVDRLASKWVGRLIEWLRKLGKKRRISKQVDTETLAVNEVRKQIDQFFKDNPDATDIPPNLEMRMRELARRRADSLRR